MKKSFKMYKYIHHFYIALNILSRILKDLLDINRKEYKKLKYATLLCTVLLVTFFQFCDQIIDQNNLRDKVVIFFMDLELSVHHSQERIEEQFRQEHGGHKIEKPSTG